MPTSAGRGARPPASPAKRLLMLLVYLIVGGYIALVLFGVFLSDRVLFQPHPAGYRDSAEILKLTVSNGKRISAVYLPNPAARFTILYSHGNALDLGDLGPFLKEMHDAGFAVLAYDYEGYGTSEGSPSEPNSYADVEAAYDYLTAKLAVPPDRIISFGHSVGGGPATELALRQRVAGLVLESSFTSAFRVLTRVPLVPYDKFRNMDKLASIHCPVLVMHGRKDAVIPFRNGPQLFAAANPPKRSFWVDEAGHDDLFFMAGRRYWPTLREFADSLGAH